MADLVDQTNGWRWVAVALAVWLVTYVWLRMVGPDSLSEVIKAILDLIPSVALVAIGLTTWAIYDDQGADNLFWSFVALGVVIVTGAMLSGTLSGTWTAFKENKWSVPGAMTSLLGDFWNAVRGYFVAVVATTAGVLGALGGYECAFGSQAWGVGYVSVAILLAIVHFVMRQTARTG